MFADVFVQLLQQNKTSALKVAKEIGVPKSVVYEWKNGQRQPSAENLMKVADHFGVPVSFLMTGEQGGQVASESENEKELLLLLREAGRFSGEDRDRLFSDIKQNLTSYLNAKKKGEE